MDEDKKIYTIRLAEALPDIKGALRILEYEFATAAALGERIVKVYHGSGATVRGGTKLRGEVRHWGKIDSRVGFVVNGEKFASDNMQTRYLLEMYPFVQKDEDLDKGNAEITLFFINRRRRKKKSALSE